MLETRDPGHLITFLIPAVLTPYVMIGWLCGELSNHIHTLFCIILFFVLSYLSYIQIPKKIMFYFGLLASSLVLYRFIHSYRIDFVWTSFWMMSYVGLSYYAFRWLSSVAEADGAFDRSEFMAGFKDRLLAEFGGDKVEPQAKSKAKDTRFYHQKVGNCQGQNTKSIVRGHHQLLKCGRCNTAGCADMDCANRNFEGSRCMTCHLSANAK